MDFLEACRRMIGIDSTPSAGTAEVMGFARELASTVGLESEIQAESWNGLDQANVIIRASKSRSTEGGAGAEEFMLQTHLDTPDPGAYALWKKTGANPFSASIYQSPDGDTIHGLGAADVKLDFLCKLYALAKAQERAKSSGKSWKISPVLVGTFGEELGMPGAIKLIRKKKVRPMGVLVGEPTGMRLIAAGKGFASVDIEIPFSEKEIRFRQEHDISESSSTQSRMFSGRAAHSSAPQLGECAIKKMLDALERLPSGVAIMQIEGGVNFNTVAAHATLEIDLISNLSGLSPEELMAQKIVRVRRAIRQVEAQFGKFPDPLFTPSEPTLNVGMIRTGEDHVGISGCVRLPPTVSQEDYESWMTIIRDACVAEGAVFRIADYKPSFRTGENSPLLAACRRVIADGRRAAPAALDIYAQAVANEANVFAKFGFDCVVMGPGQGVGNSHTPNECVRILDLHEATDFYCRVIEQVCS